MSRWSVAAALLAIAWSVAACSDGATSDAEPPLTATGTTPTATELLESLESLEGEEMTTVVGFEELAGVHDVQLGDVGIVLRDRPDSSAVTVLRGDGTAVAMPALPASLDVVRPSVAGETLLVAGVDCLPAAELCDRGGHPSVHRYVPARTTWVQVDLPEDDAADWVQPVEAPLPGRQAVLSTPSTLLVVDPTGDVRALPERTTAAERDLSLVQCGDRLVAVDRFGSTPEPSPTVLSLDLDDPEAEWTEAPTRPATDQGLRFLTCGPDGVHFFGGSLEATYDPASGRWRDRTVEWPVHLDDRRTNLPTLGDQVVLADGALVATTGSRAVVRRTADGRWEDLGRWADQLTAAGDTVYAASREHPTFQPLA